MDFVWLAATTVFIDLSADAMRTVDENPPSMPNRDYSMIVTQSSGKPAIRRGYGIDSGRHSETVRETG